MKNRRVFNNRPICFAALFLALGILTVELILPLGNLYRLIPLVLSAVFAIGLFICKKSRRFGYMAVAFLIGVLSMSGATDLYRAKAFSADYKYMQATVVSEIVVDSKKQATYFYVDEIVCDGVSLDGKAYVYMQGELVPDFNAGDTVTLFGNLVYNDHERFDTSYAYANTRKRYYTIFPSAVYKLAEGKPSNLLKLQLTIKRMFDENMDTDSASICQALVLGDKFGMDADLYEGVKRSGLAHVMAVSGLHVTALASALLFLLKKLKVNRKASFVFIVILNFLYVALCSFTPSAVRAFIMTAVLNFATAFGLKKDNLSNLSFASIILLLINPTYVMDIGFLLSIFSVLGVFIFNRSFQKIGNKILHVDPRKDERSRLVDGVSLTLSASATTFPMILLFFGSVPLLSVLSNLLLLPYLMFIYVFLLIITLFGLTTTLWGVTSIMKYLLVPFRWWTSLVGGLPWATVDATGTVALVVIWLLECVFLSGYFFLDKRKRIILTTSTAAIFAVGIVLVAVF